MKISGIYKIENLVDGRIYIGSSIDISLRWRQHIRELNRNKHENRYLQRAWNKFGAENFRFTKIELCDSEQLIIHEQYYMDKFTVCKTGYNMCPIADNVLGIKRSLETRKIMSDIARARGMIPLSKESKQKIGNFFRGRPLTEEHKRKVSMNTMGKKKKPYIHKKGTIPWNKGEIMSLEFRQKISEAMKGRVNSPETRRKISESNMGRVMSFESIQKRTETRKKNNLLKQQNERIGIG